MRVSRPPRRVRVRAVAHAVPAAARLAGCSCAEVDMRPKLTSTFAAVTVAEKHRACGRIRMPRLIARSGALAAALFALSAANAQDTVKVGLINVLSGQFADAGVQLDNGVKAYMKQHGDTVAGKKIEIVRRDVGGPAPDVAKRLAQELVVRDGVDLLAGFLLTPNALAAADVSAQAKKFMVVMNAATSVIITKSPYMIRTSVTLPQVMETFGAWAARNGIKKCYTMVTDYGPGHDSEAAFQRAFKEAGEIGRAHV